MKKALVITYYWPPSGGSGVQRWVKFTKYLPAEGWECVIYTPENPEMPSTDHSLEGDIPEGTTVLKRPITEFYSIYRSLTGKKTSTKEVNPINQQKKTFAQKVMMYLRGNLFIPDPRVSWVRPSVKWLSSYLKEHPVDVIITTGPPHSMHLIGRKLSLSTGIPWIADFRDPWTRIFYFKHLSLNSRSMKKHLREEKEVLDDATRVVAVSPLVQDEFRTMTKTPVELITNGYDPDDYAEVDLLKGDGMFNITHTGLFASDGDPDVLWKVLGEKCSQDPSFGKRLRIRLCGKNDTRILASIKEAGLEGNLVDLGYQNHDVAVKEQMNATLLILPLRKEPEYRATLPGKLFEYLGARRPILGIGQTDGAMARVVSDAKAGEVFEWEDEAGIRDFIDRCYSSFLSGEDTTPRGDIERFSRTSTAKAYASLLDSICFPKK